MPGQWPPKDLFEEDIPGRPLLSPFATGGGASTFLDLNDTPSSFSGKAGQFPKVNAGETALEFGSAGGFAPEQVFFVAAGGEVTSFDDVAYTSVQTALDAANTATPTASDQYLVLVLPGVYNEGDLTMYRYVHLAGWGAESDEGAPAIVQLGGTPGSGTSNFSSAEDSTVSNIIFMENGSTGATQIIQVTHDTHQWHNVTVQLTVSVVETQLQVGQFFNCTFINGDLQLAGSSQNSLPRLFNCYAYSTNSDGFRLTTSGASSHGRWVGGAIRQVRDTAAAHLTFNVTSNNVVLQGVVIENVGTQAGDGDIIQYDGTLDHCTVILREDDGNNFIETRGGARFNQNTFVFTSGSSTGGSATTACIFIEDLDGDDFVFTNNYVEKDINRAFIMLGTGLDLDTHKIVTNQNTFRTDNASTGSNALFAIHSTGFSGTVVWELNGNYYQARQTAMPTNAGTGRIIWRGTDIRGDLVQPAWGVGTGTVSEHDNFPGVLLDLAAETAFVLGRANPPAGIIVDAALVLSANNTNGRDSDAMTDTNGTNLSAHTPTGGSGTWTAASGTITIQSNVASCSTAGTNIYTYSVGAENGFLKATTAASSGTGTNEIGLLFRHADSSNYWRLVEVDDSPRHRLIKRVAGIETTMWDDTIITDDMAVSFDGDTIRIYEDYDGTPRLVAEIIDSDLASNTGVGIICKRTGGAHTLDDWEWHPGGTVDITVETDQAHLHQPWAQGNVASSDDNGVDVVQRGYSYHDVTVGVNEELWQVKTTLDVLNGDINEVYVHGVLVRYLPIINTEGPPSQEDVTPEVGIFHR